MRPSCFNPVYRWLLLLIPIFYLLLFMAGLATAHKLTVFAWVEGDTVHGQSKFSGGRRPKRAQIIVTDPKGHELLKTQTDESGAFSFAVPRKIGLRIQVVAGEGHRGEWLLSAEELGAPVTKSYPPPSDTPPASSLNENPPASATAGDALAQRRMIEEILDQKLRPVLYKLSEAQTRKVSLQDIIGGIGYIIGLMGIVLYYKSRSRKP